MHHFGDIYGHDNRVPRRWPAGRCRSRPPPTRTPTSSSATRAARRGRTSRAPTSRPATIRLPACSGTDWRLESCWRRDRPVAKCAGGRAVCPLPFADCPGSDQKSAFTHSLAAPNCCVGYSFLPSAVRSADPYKHADRACGGVHSWEDKQCQTASFDHAPRCTQACRRGGIACRARCSRASACTRGRADARRVAPQHLPLQARQLRGDQHPRRLRRRPPARIRPSAPTSRPRPCRLYARRNGLPPTSSKPSTSPTLVNTGKELVLFDTGNAKGRMPTAGQPGGAAGRRPATSPSRSTSSSSPTATPITSAGSMQARAASRPTPTRAIVFGEVEFDFWKKGEMREARKANLDLFKKVAVPLRRQGDLPQAARARWSRVSAP